MIVKRVFGGVLNSGYDDRIEANPHLYRPGRVPGTREAVVHPNYVMVYRIESETITILRVLHAAQRWPSAE